MLPDDVELAQADSAHEGPVGSFDSAHSEGPQPNALRDIDAAYPEQLEAGRFVKGGRCHTGSSIATRHPAVSGEQRRESEEHDQERHHGNDRGRMALFGHPFVAIPVPGQMQSRPVPRLRRRPWTMAWPLRRLRTWLGLRRALPFYWRGMRGRGGRSRRCCDFVPDLLENQLHPFAVAVFDLFPLLAAEVLGRLRSQV